VLSFPRARREAVVEEASAEILALRAALPDLTLPEVHEMLPPVLHQEWIEPALTLSLPALQTTDGDDLLPTRAVFEVTDVARVAEVLDRHAATERHEGADPPAWSWLSEDGEDGSCISSGRLELRGGELVLETLSESRAERGRALVERLGGETIRHRHTSLQHPEQMLGAHDRPGEGAGRSSRLGDHATICSWTPLSR